MARKGYLGSGKGIHETATRKGYVGSDKGVHETISAPAAGRIMSSLAGSGGLAGKGGIAGPGGGLAG